MAFWDEPDVPEQADYVSPLETGNYWRSKAMTDDYSQRFMPIEERYVGDFDRDADGRPIPGTFQKGLMSQDLSDRATTRASADIAQATHAQRKKMGPMMANRGSFSSNIGGLAQSQGAGTGQAVGQAKSAGAIDIVNRELNALRAGMGLGTGVLRSSSQAAGQASNLGQQVMRAQFDQNLQDNQSQAALMAAAAGGLGGYAGGVAGNRFSEDGTGEWDFDPADWTHLDEA